jgi:hypothetical protein
MTPEFQLNLEYKQNLTKRAGSQATPEDVTVIQTQDSKANGTRQNTLHRQIQPMKEGRVISTTSKI